MKQIDIKSLANYIALKILGGNDFILDALEEYLVKGEGPATVAHKYNISKHQLRGYAQRIIEKSGSEIRAKKLIPILKQATSEIKPVIKKSEDEYYICTLCNATMAKEDGEEHVRKNHKDVLAVTIKKILDNIELIKQERQKQAIIFTSAS
jgi:predicted RNase H-like HicB family nuclease